MDWPRLTRLQRFLRATRTRLLADYPTLPPGASVVQQNLPHGIEYAFGGDHALQVWYRDPAVHWMRFEVWRSHPDTLATVIVQGSAGHEPPVALVSPEAVRSLFAAQELVEKDESSRILTLLDHADSLQRDPDALQYWVTSRAMRAYALIQTGRAGEAETLVASMLALDPADLAARQVLALAHAEQGHFVDAFAQLDTLIAIDAVNEGTLQIQRQIDSLHKAAGSPRH
jgi:tetratricopeptide (TPR) repeat protein